MEQTKTTGMSDAEFTDLELRAKIVPQRENWPQDVLHWQHLCAVVDEGRAAARAADTLMRDIDNNPDLSPQGRDRQRRKVAMQALDDMAASKTLGHARKAVTDQNGKWDERIGMVLKPPGDAIQALPCCTGRYATSSPA